MDHGAWPVHDAIARVVPYGCSGVRGLVVMALEGGVEWRGPHQRLDRVAGGGIQWGGIEWRWWPVILIVGDFRARRSKETSGEVHGLGRRFSPRVL
jgi:hypothetical protein